MLFIVFTQESVSLFFSPFDLHQVCERAGVLRPLAGCVQVGDRPLPEPVCVWVG